MQPKTTKSSPCAPWLFASSVLNRGAATESGAGRRTPSAEAPPNSPRRLSTRLLKLLRDVLRGIDCQCRQERDVTLRNLASDANEDQAGGHDLGRSSNRRGDANKFR